jgi:hypothetical protein
VTTLDDLMQIQICFTDLVDDETVGALVQRQLDSARAKSPRINAMITKARNESLARPIRADAIKTMGEILRNYGLDGITEIN